MDLTLVKPEYGGMKKPYVYLDNMNYLMKCICCGQEITLPGSYIRSGSLLCTCGTTWGSYSIGGPRRFMRMNDGVPNA